MESQQNSISQQQDQEQRRGYPTARERVVCTDGEMGASK